MKATFSATRLALVGLLLLVTACDLSPGSPAKTHKDALPPLTFAWQAPVRVPVIESIRQGSTDMKIGYDLVIAQADNNNLQLSFKNAFVYELYGQVVQNHALPPETGRELDNFTLLVNSRPAMEVSTTGALTGINIKDQIVRALNARSDLYVNMEKLAKEAAIETVLSDVTLVATMENATRHLWNCWIGSWQNFSPDKNSGDSGHVVYSVPNSTAQVKWPAEFENHGMDAATGLLHLGIEASSQDPLLQRAFLNLVSTRFGEDLATEKLSVADITRVSLHTAMQVKIDPHTMKPAWVSCKDTFELSSENARLAARQPSSTFEYTFQWPNQTTP